MSEPVKLEKMKGWGSLGPRSRKDDLSAMVKAIKAVGEAEVDGAGVDTEHVAGSQRGIAEGVDADGRLLVVEKAPVEQLIGASLDREAWKDQGAPSKLKLFIYGLLSRIPLIGRMLRPMRRKSTQTRHKYVLRHDGYKRIHKL